MTKFRYRGTYYTPKERARYLNKRIDTFAERNYKKLGFNSPNELDSALFEKFRNPKILSNFKQSLKILDARNMGNVKGILKRSMLHKLRVNTYKEIRTTVDNKQIANKLVKLARKNIKVASIDIKNLSQLRSFVNNARNMRYILNREEISKLHEDWKNGKLSQEEYSNGLKQAFSDPGIEDIALDIAAVV